MISMCRPCVSVLKIIFSPLSINSESHGPTRAAMASTSPFPSGPLSGLDEVLYQKLHQKLHPSWGKKDPKGHENPYPSARTL